ncbi:MAG: hypothetical protein LC107_02175, partial [Chitinophagales bacterium]|nr:hypothetical protein [Chitinophagales bacterium]
CYAKIKFNSDFDIKMEKEWSLDTKVATFFMLKVMDINNDSIPEIISAKTDIDAFANEILIVDPVSKGIINTIKTCYFNPLTNSNLFLTNPIDGYEIIVAAINDTRFNPSNIAGRLVCYKFDGSVKWISDSGYGLNASVGCNGNLSFADFNGDGIPEIYTGNEIFNARTGKKLADGGKNGLGVFSQCSSIAANLDDDPDDLELAAGYTIYKVVINNPDGMTGNEMIAYNLEIEGTLIDGATIVTDINNDGRLDVIVSGHYRGNIYLYIYMMEDQKCKLLAKKVSPSFTYGGLQIAGNFSGIHEKGIAQLTRDTLRKFSYDGTDILSEDWKIPLKELVPSYAMSAFDFDNDGIDELVYRDFEELVIINAKEDKPVILDKSPCKSGTLGEYPVIADIYNTGTARICITCSDSIGDMLGYLTIFGPPEGQHWAPARNIWHQYGYNPLFIND